MDEDRVSEESSFEEEYESDDYWHHEHFNFFRGLKAWSEYHQQQKKQGRDYRDAKISVTSPTAICMFCGERPAIAKKEAVRSGLDWNEYIASSKVDGGDPFGQAITEVTLGLLLDF